MVEKKEVYVTAEGSTWDSKEAAEAEERIERVVALLCNELNGLNTEYMSTRDCALELIAHKQKLLEALA